MEALKRVRRPGGVQLPHALFDRRNRFYQVDITMEKKYHGAGGAAFAKTRGKARAGTPVLRSLAGEGIRDFIFPADRAFDPAMDARNGCPQWIIEP